MESIYKSFKFQDTLNPTIWDGVLVENIKLKSDIRENLLKIAKDFMDYINIGEVEIEDILFVGSLANYNWSEYSDIDLHIVIDKGELSDDFEIVNELFDAKKTIYNENHNIKLKGYDVEVYAQDVNENMEGSSAQYSVLYNKWVKEPTKIDFKFNKKTITKKVKDFHKKLKKITELQDSQEKIDKLQKLTDTIKKYRKSGLQRGGEFSDENMVFKYLRRSGFIKKMRDLKLKTQDSILSLENTEL